jgi:hypothetical protein
MASYSWTTAAALKVGFQKGSPTNPAVSDSDLASIANEATGIMISLIRAISGSATLPTTVDEDNEQDLWALTNAVGRRIIANRFGMQVFRNPPMLMRMEDVRAGVRGWVRAQQANANIISSTDIDLDDYTWRH